MINKVILIGNAGHTPETHTGRESGVKVASISLATNEKYTDKSGEKVTKTEWHKLLFFGKLIDVVEKYVQKGDKLYIEGKLQTRKYEGKDGTEKYTTEIIVNQMTMLGGGGRDGQPENQQATNYETGLKTKESNPVQDAEVVDDVLNGKDDLPF